MKHNPRMRFFLYVILFLVAWLQLGIQSCGEPQVDTDGDCYCSDPVTCISSENPACTTVLPGDCDDYDGTVYPGAEERCDGLDNDCDGAIEQPRPVKDYYVDNDGDGFGGDAAQTCPEDNLVAVRGDCNDYSITIYPGAQDAAGDGVDQDCGGSIDPDVHVGLAANSVSTLAQALLDAPEGSTVWVGPGEYFEMNLSFAGKALSLRSTHLAAQTTINAGQQGRVFLFTTEEQADTVLDGFTLTGGKTTSWGGAISIYSANPTIQGCRITGNSASKEGGGIFAQYFNGTLSDSVVENNTTQSNGGGAYFYLSNAFVDQVTFQNNKASYSGGGMFLKVANLTAQNIQLLGNDAWSGGGAYLYYSRPVLQWALFQDNYAAGGGGGGLSIIWSAPTIQHAIISANQASTGGGILFMQADPYGYTSFFEQLIIADNTAKTAESGAGIHLEDYWIAPVITNTIFYQTIGGYNVYSTAEAIITGPELTYSCFYTTWGSNHNLDSVDDTVITQDPELLADFHLDSTSPVVGLGDSALFNVDGTRSDMGAFGGPEADGWDLDGDKVPNYFWPGSWSTPPEGYDVEDYDCADQDAAVQSCL